MTKVGFNTWFEKQCDTVFRVKNITQLSGGKGKTVRIFGVPIKAGRTYDLMSIPEVSEADIRHSLLKGTLMMKIITDEITVTESNINLVQFDECQKSFLQGAGITEGLDPGSDGYGGVNYLWRQEVSLIGPKNGANKVFIIPPPDKFIEGDYDDNEFHIRVEHNGRLLLKFIDYIISESGGFGTGYDTIELISLVPSAKSKLVADYVVERT